MPASHHPVFKQPSDPGAKVWRYMDFTKFVAMLESSALYFARADLLGDPFEGSYSKANAQILQDVHKDLNEESLRLRRNSNAQLARSMRKWTFVSCWHMNEGESAAMWKLYAKSNEAVAIKSSYYSLANELDEGTYLGLVEYIDFDRDWLPEGNTFYPYVHKRRSFEHENEVRAVIQTVPATEGVVDYNAEPTSGGVERKVNLQRLIQAIHVAPTCPAWFAITVKQVARRYGLQSPVVQSSLDAEPFF